MFSFIYRTTVKSSQRWDVDISGHRTSTRVQCRGHSHRLVTEASRQLHHGCGTICRSNFGSRRL